MTRLTALALLATLATPAAAQDMAATPSPAPICPKDAEPIPPALAAWSTKTPRVAATDAATLSAASVAPGTAYTMTLAQTAKVTFTLPPAHPGAPTGYSGIVGFTVAQGGSYRVAIGAGAWLDVVRGGVSLRSIAHAHGPNCSGIRKMVDFTLEPGAYTLQIAGSGTATVPLLIARLP